MASSLTSPSLVFAAEKAIIATRRALAKAKMFSNDFSADAVQPGSTMKVPVFTPSTASAFSVASNNYETVDGSVAYQSVTFANHVKNTFCFADTDFNLVNGRGFWDKAGAASGSAVAKAIETAIIGGMETGATGSATIASITKANVAALRGACATADIDPSRAVLMLGSVPFATLLGLLDANLYGGPSAIRDGVVEGLYGFKAVMEAPGGFASSATTGYIVQEDALVIAGRTIEVQSPKVYEEVGYTTDEDSGLTLGFRRHGDPATGLNYATVEALFGFGVVQPAAILKLAAS